MQFIPRLSSLSAWPDWAILCFLDKHSKPGATIILPKSLKLLGNFCKGVKIIHFIVKSFWATFIDVWRFLLVTLVLSTIADRLKDWPLDVEALLRQVLSRLLLWGFASDYSRHSLGRTFLDEVSGVKLNAIALFIITTPTSTSTLPSAVKKVISFHWLFMTSIFFLNGQLPASFLRLCTFFQSNFTK